MFQTLLFDEVVYVLRFHFAILQFSNSMYDFFYNHEDRLMSEYLKFIIDIWH